MNNEDASPAPAGVPLVAVGTSGRREDGDIEAALPVESGLPEPTSAVSEAAVAGDAGNDAVASASPVAATEDTDRGPKLAPTLAAAGPSWFWRRGFPVVMAALVLSVPALLVAGRTVVLGSTEGVLEEGVADPAAPGWEALAEPTPTLLVEQRGSEGELVAVTVLSLSGERGGGVLFVPVETLPAGEAASIAERGSDADATRAAVESALGIALADVVVLTPRSWDDLLAPVAPLAIDNPDDVLAAGPDGRSALAFAKGALKLPAAEAARYLSLRSPGESDLNRLVRHEAFWRAWFQSVAAAPAGAPSGERDSGLGRFVPALAAGRVEFQTLPVQRIDDRAVTERFAPVADRLRAVVGRLVPFPVGSPAGSRLRVRLLDGVGTLHHGLDAAPAVVGHGGQIDQIGNASRFGVERTQLAYVDESRRAEVEDLAAALGGGEIIKATDNMGAADVVITLGRDYRDAPRSPGAASSGTTGVGHG